MEFQNKRDWLSLVGTAIIGVLTINSIYPFGYSISRELASHTVVFLFLFLGIGVLSFLLKRHLLMLASFVACIALCQFMKAAQSDQFAYSCLTKDTKITVAHFKLDGDTVDSLTICDIKKIKAELIIIQTVPTAQVSQLLDKHFIPSHPHFRKTADKQRLAILLYSKYPIFGLDTVYYSKDPNLAGTLVIDSMHVKLSFVTGYLSNNPSKNVYEVAEQQLARLSHYLDVNNKSESPLLAIGTTRLACWAPELQKFKTKHTLNGSRLDLELAHTDEYIFYSSHLRCIGFDYILEGKGVRGTYQFKEVIKLKKPLYHTEWKPKYKITF